MKFDKYATISADYHYRQTDKHSFRNFNASVYARFKKTAQIVSDLIKEGERVGTLRILDVGCGDGVAISFMRKHLNPDVRLYGAEPDEEALEVAKKRNPQAHFVQADAESLPFEDNYFDLVISTDVIEHVNDPGKMLAEIRRVAKLGADIVISTPIRRAKNPVDPQHVQEFFQEDFLSLIESHFNRCVLKESHNLIPTLLYNYPTRTFLNFRYAINALAIFLNINPFLSERSNKAQIFSYMYAICKK